MLRVTALAVIRKRITANAVTLNEKKSASAFPELQMRIFYLLRLRLLPILPNEVLENRRIARNN